MLSHLFIPGEVLKEGEKFLFGQLTIATDFGLLVSLVKGLGVKGDLLVLASELKEFFQLILADEAVLVLVDVLHVGFNHLVPVLGHILFIKFTCFDLNR